MVFTEGFDCVGIECIQMLRPTTSLSLWLQMLGRGLRIAPGKEYCTILDHTDNALRLGFPDDPVCWSLDAVSLPEDSVRALKHDECGHLFRPLPHELKPVKLIQVNRDGSYTTLHHAKCPNCGQQIEFEQKHSIHDQGEKPELEFVKSEAMIEISALLNPEPTEQEFNQITNIIDELFHKEVEVLGHKPFAVWHRFKEDLRILEHLDQITREHLEYLRVKIYCPFTEKPRPGWVFYAMKELVELA